MLVPPSLALLLLFVVMFAPIYPVTATETVITHYAMGGGTTEPIGQSVVYNSSIEVISGNFKWESKSQRFYLGMDYDQTITTYEASPYVLGLYLLMPLLAFFLTYFGLRRMSRGEEEA